MAVHRGWKRIIDRSLEELRATCRIAKITSIPGAAVTFISKIDIQRMNRNGFKETPAIKRRLLKKHQVMQTFFEKEFASFVSEYNYNRVLPETRSQNSKTIWVCWWQGIESAPDLVKVCINSVRRNAGDGRVVVITEENYRDYVSIPQWVVEKYKTGIISRTHFSDILRLCLLAEHGGLWLDATFYCVADLNPYFQYPIWSIKRPGYQYVSVAGGQFATYSLGCTYENRWIFATLRDFLLHYWEENNILIDYLMLDYLFVQVQKADRRIADLFANIAPNNPCCDNLINLLGEPFDEKKWMEIKEKTALFKLTWKQEFPIQINGCDTFYSKLLKGKL